jgi:hypothetical protein
MSKKRKTLTRYVLIIILFAKVINQEEKKNDFFCPLCFQHKCFEKNVTTMFVSFSM